MDYTSRLYAFLQPADPSYFGRVKRCLDPQPQDKILEIGCGRGYTTKKVQQVAPQTFGIDLNEKAVQNGVAKNLQTMNAEALLFPDNTFDKIYSFHTVEHIPNIAKALGEMARVLKPGGKACIIIGNTNLRGVEISNAQVTAEQMQVAGFKKLDFIKHVQSSFSLFWLPEFRTVLRKKM